MTKVCKECLYRKPTPEKELEPPDAAEDCPKCGGIKTVVDEDEIDEEEGE